eukprot:SAG11_NODE_24768_length_368_cov_0.959108_1_plen_28_part_10
MMPMLVPVLLVVRLLGGSATAAAVVPRG